MKLRNKETGIIGELHFEPDKEYHFTVATEDPADVMIYKKLADLRDDWEDTPEEHKRWFIDPLRYNQVSNFLCYSDEEIENVKELGFDFDTLGEVEEAVEKLKAWKRLKDKGFKFKGGDDACISYEFPIEKWNSKLEKDFELLFGGEE